MRQNKLFNSKTAKGLVSLTSIIILLSSILASTFYFDSSITANVAGDVSAEEAYSIKEINDIKELSQLNEGWYLIREGYVFYLETFDSEIPIHIKVNEPANPNAVVVVDADGNIAFDRTFSQLAEKQEAEISKTNENRITGQVVGLESISGMQSAAPNQNSQDAAAVANGIVLVQDGYIFGKNIYYRYNDASRKWEWGSRPSGRGWRQLSEGSGAWFTSKFSSDLASGLNAISNNRGVTDKKAAGAAYILEAIAANKDSALKVYNKNSAGDLGSYAKTVTPAQANNLLIAQARPALAVAPPQSAQPAQTDPAAQTPPTTPAAAPAAPQAAQPAAPSAPATSAPSQTEIQKKWNENLNALEKLHGKRTRNSDGSYSFQDYDAKFYVQSDGSVFTTGGKSGNGFYGADTFNNRWTGKVIPIDNDIPFRKVITVNGAGKEFYFEKGQWYTDETWPLRDQPIINIKDIDVLYRYIYDNYGSQLESVKDYDYDTSATGGKYGGIGFTLDSNEFRREVADSYIKDASTALIGDKPNTAAAKIFVDRAAAAKPSNSYTLNSIGFGYEKLGDIDKAYLYYERAVNALPKDTSESNRAGYVRNFNFAKKYKIEGWKYNQVELEYVPPLSFGSENYDKIHDKLNKNINAIGGLTWSNDGTHLTKPDYSGKFWRQLTDGSIYYEGDSTHPAQTIVDGKAFGAVSRKEITNAQTSVVTVAATTAAKPAETTPAPVTPAPAAPAPVPAPAPATPVALPNCCPQVLVDNNNKLYHYIPGSREYLSLSEAGDLAMTSYDGLKAPFFEIKSYRAAEPSEIIKAKGPDGIEREWIKITDTHYIHASKVGGELGTIRATYDPNAKTLTPIAGSAIGRYIKDYAKQYAQPSFVSTVVAAPPQVPPQPAVPAAQEPAAPTGSQRQVEVSVKPVPDELDRKIQDYAIKYGVDKDLVRAIINIEAVNFDPNSKSPKGAVGYMQLMPNTAKSYQLKVDESNPAKDERYNPDKNLEAGIRYLKDLLDKHNGDVALALSEYNSGAGDQIATNKETQEYVSKVLASYNYYDRNGNPRNIVTKTFSQPATITNEQAIKALGPTVNIDWDAQTINPYAAVIPQLTIAQRLQLARERLAATRAGLSTAQDSIQRRQEEQQALKELQLLEDIEKAEAAFKREGGATEANLKSLNERLEKYDRFVVERDLPKESISSLAEYAGDQEYPYKDIAKKLLDERLRKAAIDDLDDLLENNWEALYQSAQNNQKIKDYIKTVGLEDSYEIYLSVKKDCQKCTYNDGIRGYVDEDGNKIQLKVPAERRRELDTKIQDIRNIEAFDIVEGDRVLILKNKDGKFFYMEYDSKGELRIGDEINMQIEAPKRLVIDGRERSIVENTLTKDNSLAVYRDVLGDLYDQTGKAIKDGTVVTQQTKKGEAEIEVSYEVKQGRINLENPMDTKVGGHEVTPQTFRQLVALLGDAGEKADIVKDGSTYTIVNEKGRHSALTLQVTQDGIVNGNRIDTNPLGNTFLNSVITDGKTTVKIDRAVNKVEKRDSQGNVLKDAKGNPVTEDVVEIKSWTKEEQREITKDKKTYTQTLDSRRIFEVDKSTGKQKPNEYTETTIDRLTREPIKTAVRSGSSVYEIQYTPQGTRVVIQPESAISGLKGDITARKNELSNLESELREPSLPDATRQVLEERKNNLLKEIQALENQIESGVSLKALSEEEINKLPPEVREKIKKRLSDHSKWSSRRFFQSYERILTEFRGLGGYAYLTPFFWNDDELLKWRNDVDKFFAKGHLGIEYWTSDICDRKLDGEQQGVAFAETPQGLAQVAAHIEATRSDKITDEKGEASYIYKITFNVRNGDYEKDLRAPENMSINVYIGNSLIQEGARAGTKVFKEDKNIGRGKSFGRMGTSAIVKESNNLHTEICMTFDKVPLKWKIKDKVLCNRIQVSGTPSKLEKRQQQTQDVELNDF